MITLTSGKVFMKATSIEKDYIMSEKKFFIILNGNKAASEKLVRELASKMNVSTIDGDVIFRTGPKWNRPATLVSGLRESVDNGCETAILLVDRDSRGVLKIPINRNPRLIDDLERTAGGASTSWQYLHERVSAQLNSDSSAV